MDRASVNFFEFWHLHFLYKDQKLQNYEFYFFLHFLIQKSTPKKEHKKNETFKKPEIEVWSFLFLKIPKIGIWVEGFLYPYVTHRGIPIFIQEWRKLKKGLEDENEYFVTNIEFRGKAQQTCNRVCYLYVEIQRACSSYPRSSGTAGEKHVNQRITLPSDMIQIANCLLYCAENSKMEKKGQKP